MNTRVLLHWLVVIIAFATVLTGLVQMVAASFVLGILSAEITPTTTHFFSIIGMFMVLFGGATLQAMTNPTEQRAIILWAAFQKLGASLAVIMGVANDVFSALALGVAFFDLASGVLYLMYRNRTRPLMVGVVLA